VALLVPTSSGSIGGVSSGRPNLVGEIQGVDLGRGDVGAIADSVTRDQFLEPHGSEGSAQLRDPDLQGVHRVHRQCRVGPQPVDEQGGREDPARREKQLDQQGAFGHPRQLRRHSVHERFHRPEQMESEVFHAVPLR
jgi:hypothetical protein